jgi:hypothetical protein
MKLNSPIRMFRNTFLSNVLFHKENRRCRIGAPQIIPKTTSNIKGKSNKNFICFYWCRWIDKNFLHLFYFINFYKYHHNFVEFSIIRCSAMFFFYSVTMLLTNPAKYHNSLTVLWLNTISPLNVVYSKIRYKNDDILKNG